jgi:hypothetical protein
MVTLIVPLQPDALLDPMATADEKLPEASLNSAV